MIHVHVSRKVQRQPAGTCAHFCPFCRRITLYDVSSMSSVLAINGIPVGKAKPTGDELTCRACSVPLKFPPGVARPASVEPDATNGDLGALAELAEQTSPWGIEQLLSRLDLEARLRSGLVSPVERALLIAEPFDAVEYSATLLATKGMSRTTGFVTAAFIVGLIAAAILWANAIAPPGGTWVIRVAAVAVSIGTLSLVPVLVRRAMRESRDARRAMVLDPLSRALAAIEPCEEELRAELQRCAKAKSQVGKRVRESDLLSILGIAPLSAERSSQPDRET